MKSDFMMALESISHERKLKKADVLDAIEAALASAFRRDDPAGGQNLSVKLNPNTGEISIFALRKVVAEVEFPDREIALADALKIRSNVQIGDEIAESEEVPHDASRIAAQTARQVIMQRLREEERKKDFQEISAYQGKVVSGSVDSIEKGRTVFVNLHPRQAQAKIGARGIMRAENQVGSERYRKGQNLKVLLVEVQETARGPEVVVSRSHRDLLRRLMESEVPEIENETVEIRAIARDAGTRSKVAVATRQEGVDPVGSCIGLRGNRIQSIVNELQGEKIDVIEWDADPRVLITRALSPADVGRVELDPDENTAYVVVPETQMTLAIGRDGQNARLAARLTGWRLDIKNVEQWETLRAARAAEEARTASESGARRGGPEADWEGRAEAVGTAPAGTVVDVVAAAGATAEPAVAMASSGGDLRSGDGAGAGVAVGDIPAAGVPIGDVPGYGAGSVSAVSAAEGSGPEPDYDEEALLAELIAEEEAAIAAAAATAQTPEPAAPSDTVGLSVDALENLTIDDVIDEPVEVGIEDGADLEEDGADPEDEEEFGEEGSETEVSELLAGLPNLAPDAGKIRFAEDIVGDFRGGAGRRRRGGGNRRGGNAPGASGPGPRRR